MYVKHSKVLAAFALAVGLAACGETAKLPFSAGIGANPTLPPPSKSLIPTVHIAPAKGWPNGAKPVPAAGTSVIAFAAGLDHPRWIYVLPNGDVLVAETNAPPKPEGSKGIRGWIMKGRPRACCMVSFPVRRVVASRGGVDAPGHVIARELEWRFERAGGPPSARLRRQG